MTFPVNVENASIVEREPFVDTRNATREAVTLSSDTVDSTNTPTTQLRKGLVLGYDAGTDLWIDAADAIVDENERAIVDSDEVPDSDWDTETLTVVIDGIEYNLTFASVASLQDAVDEILDSELGAAVDAGSDGSGNLRLTSKKAGVRMSVSMTLATAFGGSTQVNTAELSKFGILEETIVSMLDIGGTAAKRRATVITRNAVVRGSLLLGMTDEAREALVRNNIQFYDEA